MFGRTSLKRSAKPPRRSRPIRRWPGTNGVTTTRSYNAANQVIGFSYDAVGNLTSDGARTYAYDALSRTTSASAAVIHAGADTPAAALRPAKPST
jgi:uncharacterized protein RhaS with RHS repeats